MKKFLIIVVSLVVLVTIFIFFNASKYEAEFIYDDNTEYISYGNDLYVEWSHVADSYLSSGIVHDRDMSPYNLVSENSQEKIYISDSFIQDLLSPYYFSFYQEGNDFIALSPHDTSLNTLYVKEGFVFPDIQKTQVDAVWMSLSPSDNGNLTDEDTVKRIVDCIKSEKPLDENISDHILEKSWDNSHFYIKYKGYPLTEDFFITETEDGKYIVSQ